MSRLWLVPRMALQSIRKNSAAYLPYIGTCIFAMFTYFVFGLILNNDVMETIPRAAYAQALMLIGFILLAIIMVPFLFYTNSFLIKRRKKELGLYSILGMEKKHIGMMLFVETAVIYAVVEAAAVGLGLLFFGVISLMNLITNLWQVGKANPIDLMSESKKGEKEPKAIWFWSILGVLALGTGYRISIRAQVNSMIFTDFFLAVFLVVVGTYFLFASGTIAILRFCRRRRRFYYRPENFITISGILYRMKKSAASLANICIFGTMVIITMVCTVSLYLGMPLIKDFAYPYLVEINFMESAMTETDKQNLLSGMEALAEQNQVSIEESQYYSYVECIVGRVGDDFVKESEGLPFEDIYRLKLLTLEEFNRMEQADDTLEEGEVLLFSSGPDFLPKGEAGANTGGNSSGPAGTVYFMGNAYQIKEELQECAIGPKARDNTFGGAYAVIVREQETLGQIAALYGVDAVGAGSFKIQVTPETSGNRKEAAGNVETFVQQLEQLSAKTAGFASFAYYEDDILDQESMYGGLLFIGIFFALIFMICLLVIMYYKQITEGYEDRSSFEIMQKVGMSDREVRSTIRKQILMVFFLPLIGAFCHTAAGMNMVMKLMGTLNLFASQLLTGCAAGVSIVFAVVYIFCYQRTARTYYKIVRWR